MIFGDLVARHPEQSSQHLKLLVNNGRNCSAEDYLKARARQQALSNNFTAQMAPYDAVLTSPATGQAPEGLDLPVTLHSARHGR